MLIRNRFQNTPEYNNIYTFSPFVAFLKILNTNEKHRGYNKLFDFLEVLTQITFSVISVVCSLWFRFLPKLEFEKNNNLNKNVNTIYFLEL